MSLVQCRYNPNHKMKASKREIHEQKCPDRFTCKIKYKHCPYDPLELIEEKDYEKHILECKSRPNITIEEQEEIERASQLNDIATEREQILYARNKYYKGCVEEPDIPGISQSTKKKNKKKQNKYLNKKFSELTKKESNHLAAMAAKVGDDDDGGYGNESHHLENFTGDQNFDLEFGSKNEETNEIKGFGNNFEEKKEKEKVKEEGKEKQKEKGKEEQKRREKQMEKNVNKNESNKNENNFRKNQGLFFEYDPNEEDRLIGKFSANIVNPEEIQRILND